MKLRALAAVLVAAALGTATAVAAPPPGKGKPGATTTTTTTTTTKGKKPTTGANCRPQVPVIFTGTLAANGAAAPSTLSVKVTGGNAAAKAYKAATQPVSVAITATTKVSRMGDHDPSHLKSGDRVNIQAKVCKADLKAATPPALTASRVTATAPSTTTTTSTTP